MTTCPICTNPILDGDAISTRQGLTFHAGCDGGGRSHPHILESLHQRIAALEAEMRQHCHSIPTGPSLVEVAILNTSEGRHPSWLTPATPQGGLLPVPAAEADYLHHLAIERGEQSAPPQGDEAAVDELRCWSVGYEYYYDAYFGPDAPFGNQQPTAATLSEALQLGARLVPRAMMAKDAEIAKLRAELAAERSSLAAKLAGAGKAEYERVLAELAAAEEKLAKHMADGPLTQVDAEYLTQRLREAADEQTKLRTEMHARQDECNNLRIRLSDMRADLAAERERRANVESGKAIHLQMRRRAEDQLAAERERREKAERERDEMRVAVCQKTESLGAILNITKQRDTARAQLAEAVALLRELSPHVGDGSFATQRVVQMTNMRERIDAFFASAKEMT